MNNQSPPGWSRRGLLSAAAVAGVAGVATAWWRMRPGPPADGALSAFWTQTLESPQGEPMPLAVFQGARLVINFWATWCPPCVQELPMLDRFYSEQHGRGWTVLGLAVDQPSAVRAFLQKTPLAFPVAMAGLGGTELARSLGNASGGLPFTLVLNPQGEVIQRKLGRLAEDDLKRWAELPSP
jgi:thiol-disulfide isomerase/thioredoxin